MKDYKDLQIWQKADKLAHTVYQLTKTFPKSEAFGMTSQLCRASLSVPTNIVEGFYRGCKEFVQFLVIAMGSLKETEYLLNFAHQQGYITPDNYTNINKSLDELSRMLAVFTKKLTSSPAKPLTS